MKTSKSPEKPEVTPKKMLKQARLPFKLISEVSTSPTTPQTRKRKLSATDAETAPKIGRISKENDLVENTVVISDEECVDTEKSSHEEKPLNPFVKLVDTAWKKKLQKKKKTSKRSTKHEVSDAASTENHSASNKNEVEEMDVDSPLPEKKEKECEKTTSKVNGDAEIKPTPRSRKAMPTKRVARKAKAANKTSKKSSEASDTNKVLVLDDSNPSDNFVATVEEKQYFNSESPSKDDEEYEKSEEEVKDKITKSPEKGKAENIPSSEQDKEVGKSSKSLDSKDSSPSDEEIQLSAITPKRSSARNKAKTEKKDKNLQKTNSKDESICSNPSTPKQNRSSSITTSLDESLNASTNLTPKQMQKKLESAKKKEEREKEKLEREKKRQQEKEERAKQRQEKEEQKKKEREEKEEAKRREKEEKEEQRRKEKEEKDRQREFEKKLKEEKEELKRKEREEKEEQRKKEKEARDEEKRKRQEALELEKQEQELKKKKAAEAFANFFVPKQKTEKDQPTLGPVSKSSVLSSFAIKSDMRLAPTIRVNLSDEKKEILDSLLEKQNADSVLYLNSLKDGHKPLSSERTWPISDKDDDDVMIVEDELPPSDGAGEIITCEAAAREKLRPKLLSFEENRRPPYWGTWRKKSAVVKPRRPFGQDQKLDYEVDSDSEWEEEPEGESVDGSACGSDDSDADEYEVDNEVFVPHGYLSDEEATMDDDDVLSLSPETQKARLKHLEDEFESEMKKPTEKIKPRLYGLLWESSDGGKPDKCVDAIRNYFGKMAMIMNDPTPLMQPQNEPDEAEKRKVKKKKVVSEGEKQSPKSDKKKKPKPENKESKPKNDPKKNTPEVKKNQPGINSFLTKIKSA